MVLEPERTAASSRRGCRRRADGAAPPADGAVAGDAADKSDAENMGVSKSRSADGARYLICAGCDLGPFGRSFRRARADVALGEKVPFYVAVNRVFGRGALD